MYSKYIANQLLALDIQGMVMTLSTGVVPFDFTTIASEEIDSYGNAINIDGPGYITYEGDKLAVKGPDNYVWAYSAPSKVLTKTSSGVDIDHAGLGICRKRLYYERIQKSCGRQIPFFQFRRCHAHHLSFRYCIG